MEDAGLLRPEGGPTMVFTVDFITPIVDDPHTFGAIAAANSLSDVYAMGGDPQTALVVCGFPSDKLPLEVLREVFAGGREKSAEAGCAIVGGHTVLDPEFKYGLSVIGSVPGRALTQQGARAGDLLVLTKPLGTGIAAQAIKSDGLSESEIAEAVRSMTTLNRAARDAALACQATAATDVTGFGLLGHLRHLLEASGVGARLSASSVPRMSFAARLAAEGSVPGGSKRNLSYVEPLASWPAGLTDADKLVLTDAQTSGGLLFTVPAGSEARIVDLLAESESPAGAVIGEIVEAPPGSMTIES
jgi:selenide,water dikinase